MSNARKCRSCGSIRQTSPGQVFWRCDFWCGTVVPDAIYPREWSGSKADRGAYALLHCHVHPDSPACPNHTDGPLPDGAKLTGGELLAMREISSGVPAAVAMACAGLVGVAS